MKFDGTCRARPRRALTWGRAAALTLLALALPSCARAHVIPNEATIHAFLKPEGQRLRLLVRVPLETMRDLDYPKRGTQEFLDLSRADRTLHDLATLWIADNVEMYEGGHRLPYPEVVEVRASLAFDPSFASYGQAFAHVTGPRLSNSVDFVWEQGLLDVLFEYPIASDRSEFAVHSALNRLALRTTTSLTFVPPSGGVRAFEFVGDPGLISLDPRWYQAVARFVTSGVLQIVRGSEYWLFLLCLVMPLRHARSLVPAVVAFIVAEAITLSPSSYSLAPDALWFQPFIGVLIAVFIMYMALENAIGRGFERRWTMAFLFGLVLGFRFSLPLRQTLQFAGTHRLTSQLSFGLGVELGQLLVLAVIIPALAFLYRFIVREPIGTIVLSILSGHIAWHWMMERGDLLSQYQFQWPPVTPAFWLTLVRWTTDLVIAGAIFWLLSTIFGRSPRERPAGFVAPAKH